MIIRSVSGADIDQLLTLAMASTIDSLVTEGHLSPALGEAFCASHICLPVTDDSVWRRIRRWMGIEGEKDTMRPVIFKIAHTKALKVTPANLEVKPYGDGIP